MILVDSSVWIDYFNGVDKPHTDKLDRLLGSEPLVIGDLILMEVLQGFVEDREFDRAKKLLSSFVVIVLGGRDIAIPAARHFRSLRRLGVTFRKTVDGIIATRCIVDGYELLHNDRDFNPFVKHLGLRSVL
jgi:predicted nucleic acid-binding protein